MSNDPSNCTGGFDALHVQPASAATITEPVSASTATTCAPTIPVTNLPLDVGGNAARANGFAGRMRPRTAAM